MSSRGGGMTSFNEIVLAAGSGAYALLIAPFSEFAFMRRGLVACLALAMGCGPVGVLLVLRRMSLMADAMSHAVLPGAAVAYVLFGLSLPALGGGGLIAGLVVAVAAGLITRATSLREDASFAALTMISLAAGVLIVSVRGGGIDLLHVLFGAILAVDDASLILIATITTLTLPGLALIYRPLVVECFDPAFLRAVRGGGGLVHLAFLVLVVLNLVAGFQALGTLMAVGLMMLPAAAARFWALEVGSQAAVAVIGAFLAGYGGLLLSFHADLPSGPAIILVAGIFYLLSMGLGRYDSLRTRWFPGRHLSA
ncbi:zinc/manganese transport system permease protein [uncultured Gammaproteobacteria bacterium]